LLQAAKLLGLKAKAVNSTANELQQTPLPALAFMNDGRVVLLAQCDGQRVLFMDPGAVDSTSPTIEPLSVFQTQWSGKLMLATSRASLAGELAKFDFSWFIPSIVKHRKLLGEVLLVSTFLQLFALVSPLFFQAVMDKVLVHQGLTTLDVLVLGLAVVVIFESVLTVLRSYIFSLVQRGMSLKHRARFQRGMSLGGV
jgi:subfamily B ATP-binding cassette protein HlyB/CyaB